MAAASATADRRVTDTGSPRQSAASATCEVARHATQAAAMAPAPPTPHRSNGLAKPARFAHEGREWYRSTSLSSGCLLQNPRINDQAQRQANPLIPLNLISDQALSESLVFQGGWRAVGACWR